ncbi:3522_t:CDS:2 [Funneliformis mosseae]|uniref:3522_t:CDS:1 n=1 Tax=Funneliformis mosseae TaxID=27381 RepID=A0A9N9DHP0_FUNMO|nr:3522_t:CDS:2 [Funneliformis mosseae]
MGCQTNFKETNDNVDEWTQKDFVELERYIHNLIPFIRFYEISSEDYFKKFKTLTSSFAKHVNDDINSKLFEQKHFLSLANSIDEKHEYVIQVIEEVKWHIRWFEAI